MNDNKTEFLRYRLKKAIGFIREMERDATNYGSTFSEGVLIDCQNFLRDNPAPKDSTHVVITRNYLRQLQRCAVDRLKLKTQLRKFTT